MKGKILEWALSKGVSISNLSGIRFYLGADKNKCYIRLNDEESSGVAEKYKVLLNYFWGGGRIEAHDSLLDTSITGTNNIYGKSYPYHVQKVVMYGYSKYNNESKGSKLTYNYDHNKNFN